MTSSTIDFSDFLPFPIPYQILRQRLRIFQIIGQQQMQGFLGVSRRLRVETRRKLESDIETCQVFPATARPFQGDKPGRRVCSTVPILRRLKSGFRR